MPGCRVEAVTPNGRDLLHMTAYGIRPGGRCPDCARAMPCIAATVDARLTCLKLVECW